MDAAANAGRVLRKRGANKTADSRESLKRSNESEGDYSLPAKRATLSAEKKPAEGSAVPKRKSTRGNSKENIDGTSGGKKSKPWLPKVFQSDLADQFVPSVDVLEDEQQLETSVSSLRSRSRLCSGSRDSTGLYRLRSDGSSSRTISSTDDSFRTRVGSADSFRDRVGSGDSFRSRVGSGGAVLSGPSTRSRDLLSGPSTRSRDLVPLARNKENLLASVRNQPKKCSKKTSKASKAATSTSETSAESVGTISSYLQLPPAERRKIRVVDCGFRGDGAVCRCVSGLTELRTASSVSRSTARSSFNRPLLASSSSESDDGGEDESSGVSDDSDDMVESSEDTSDEETFYDHSADIDDDYERHTPPSNRVHRCTASCPFGCRGLQRPSEIIIYEGTNTSTIFKSGHAKISRENPVCVQLQLNSYKRVGGRGSLKSSSSPASGPVSSDDDIPHNLPVMPQRIAVVLDKPQVSEETALPHTWNPQDRSFNIRMKEDDPFTIRRQPVAQSTDSARTIRGYSSGLHIFQVTWPLKQRGTHAAVGVSTDRQILHSIGYSSLIGLSDQSWGWDLGRLKAFHNSSAEPGVDYPQTKPKDFSVKKRFYLVVDCDAGNLGFISGGTWLGVAHTGLKGKTLYPTVSGVWGHCEVTLRYHGGLDSSVLRLSELCRASIRGVCADIRSLPLPRVLKNYLNHQSRECSM